VNDTLLKAWDVIPPSRPEVFGAFLVKITRNLSINRWTAKSAAKRGGGEIPLLLSELTDCIPSLSGPEQEYEASHITETINSFLEGIDKTARVIFILRYFHGESINTISERFKMSESKTKSTLFRTRKKLKLHLEKEGVVI
jgi:RNA polymerase sigma-70 factor (ECF subfamily)